jgi:hypothetical protein
LGLEKSGENRCVRHSPRLKVGSNQQGKEAKHKLKILKAIMIVAVAASALSLGACAQKKETVTTDTSAAHTYSK